MLLYYCMHLARVPASIYCHSVSVVAMLRYCMDIMTQVGNLFPALLCSVGNHHRHHITMNFI